MADPLFMEPIKGSKVLIQSRGRYVESLAYLHQGKLFCKYGSSFLALRKSTVAPSGAFASLSDVTIETFELPQGVTCHL